MFFPCVLDSSSNEVTEATDDSAASAQIHQLKHFRVRLADARHGSERDDQMVQDLDTQ